MCRTGIKGGYHSIMELQLFTSGMGSMKNRCLYKKNNYNAEMYNF